MATTTVSDIKNYDSQMVGGFLERLTQNTNAFNASSAGCIRMLNEGLVGDYAKESFFKNMTGLSRRDDTSIADAAAAKFVMDENISVKLKRKFLVEATRDSFRTQGLNPDEASFLAGQQMADETKQEMLNTTIAALDAFLSAQEVNTDVSADGEGNKLSHFNLNKALRTRGDSSSGIALWVMSGFAFHDLMGGMLNGQTPQFNDSGISVYNGSVPTLSRPVLVTDCASLSPNGKHVILGLSSAAALCKISEDPEAISHIVSGKENLITRFQGEAAYNLQLKGAKWDTANGGRNPSTGAVATASNWDSNVTSSKSMAGVRLVVAQ